MDDTGTERDCVQATVECLSQMIAFPTVSATSNVAVNQFVATRLEKLGFSVEETRYVDHSGITKSNLVACRMPPDDGFASGFERDAHAVGSTGLAYFCHTDVVPAKKWVGAKSHLSANADPFTATVTDERVYGRGSCDMKGSLACMLASAEKVDPTKQTSPLWIVCTADEEVGFDGAKHVVENSRDYRKLVQTQPVAIIGEPTELNVVYAHKGIQGIRFQSRGRAGHSATRYGINANEAMVPMLNLMLEIGKRTESSTDLQDPRFDPPTLSWNFGMSDHSDVVNITPERSDAWVCFRTMPDINGADLVAELHEMAQSQGLSARELSGCDPLWTDPDVDCVTQMQKIAGTQKQAVCYGTDGGVLTELKHRIVIGPGSIEQAHTIDEWISIDQIKRGIECFEKAIRHWCTNESNSKQ